MQFSYHTLATTMVASVLWGTAGACEPQVSGVPDTSRAKAADVAVAADLDGFLIDPNSSIRKMLRGPRAGSIKEVLSDRWTGDIVCYSINSKNRYGGYVGSVVYVFVVADGVVTRRFNGDDYSYIVEDECALPADPNPVP